MLVNRRKLLGMLSTTGLIVACGQRPSKERWPIQMGDSVRCGWFTYNVLEVAYKSQLSDGMLGKRAKNGFLLIRLQATSIASKPVFIPFLQLESQSGETITEVENASELENWMGLIRRVEPDTAETGWLVFDTMPGTYGLRLTDGVLENEQTAFVRIPYQVESALK